MFLLRRACLAVAAMSAAALWSGAAFAATCPSIPTAFDRVFTVTPSISCLGSGSGNLDTNFVIPTGYVLLDKSDDAGSGALPGLFTLTPPTSGTSGTWSIGATLLYNTFIIGLKSGEGNGNPDWAAFDIGAVLAGTWSITDAPSCPAGQNCNGVQELSHGNLYGRFVEPPCTGPQCNPGGSGEVPIPGAFLLMGTVLAGGGGFAAWRRRRERSAS